LIPCFRLDSQIRFKKLSLSRNHTSYNHIHAQPSYFLFFNAIVIKTCLLFCGHPSSGKMKKTKLLISTALTALLLASLMALSAFATTVPAFTLSAQSTQLQYVMPQGTTFNGTISTTGSVRFWVNAPNEAKIVDLGIIDKTTTFSFVAHQNGTYTLNFENDMSNSIQVTFSYTTNPQIPDSNNLTGISLIYLLVTVIIAVFGSLLIIFIIRRKSKIPSSGVHNTVPSNPSLHL